MLLMVVGCAGPVRSLYPPKPGEQPRTVYVINHGNLHTGLAVKRADIPKHLLPAKDDYPNAKYLELGWGDDDVYRRGLTSPRAMRALAGSPRTVLQMDGFRKSVRENFPDPKYVIIEIQLSERGFEAMCRYIEQTYALDSAGRPIRLGDDWYKSRRTYGMFYTCNHWVASSLRAAGCPITPVWCNLAGPLLKQAGKIGRVVTVERSN
jgi:hypothetical protein